MSELGPPKKRFGQHFLKDPNTARIVASGVTEDDVVLEIGPGRGFLTDFPRREGGLVHAGAGLPTCSRACVRPFANRDNVSFMRETLRFDYSALDPRRTGWPPTFRTTSPRRSYCGCSRKSRR